MPEDELVPSSGEYSSNGCSPQPCDASQITNGQQTSGFFPARARHSLGTDGESEDSRGDEHYDRTRDSPPPLISIKDEVDDIDEVDAYSGRSLSRIFRRDERDGHERDSHERDSHEREVPLDFSLKKMKHSSPLPAASRVQLDHILAARIRDQRASELQRVEDPGSFTNESFKSGPDVLPARIRRDRQSIGALLTSPKDGAGGASRMIPPGISHGTPLHAMLQAGLLPPALLNTLPMLQTGSPSDSGRSCVPLEMSPDKNARRRPGLGDKASGLLSRGAGLLAPGLPPGTLGMYSASELGQASPLAGLDMVAAQSALAANSEELFSHYRQYMNNLVQQNRNPSQQSHPQSHGSGSRSAGRGKQRKYSCGGSASGSPPVPTANLSSAMQAPLAATTISHFGGELSTRDRALVSPHHAASAAASVDLHEDQFDVMTCSPTSVVSQGSPSTSGSLMSNAGRKRPRATPDERKDAAYWERRRKNNEAAKRSRDARRAKEDEIAIRAAFLEQENLKLRMEVASLKSETSKLRCMIYNS